MFWVLGNRIPFSYPRHEIFLEKFDTAESMSEKYSLLLDPVCAILTADDYGEKKLGQVVCPSAPTARV